jgi:hypothetical protein
VNYRTRCILRASRYRVLEQLRRNRLPEGGQSLGVVFRSREFRQMVKAGQMAVFYTDAGR